MPIEIRELHVKLSVVGTGSQPAAISSRGAGRPEDAARSAADEELVARCVEQVMELLRSRGER